MKIVMRITLMITSLSLGFAAGFPIGQNIGFNTGSEWAFVQASLVAREFGLFMPVNLVEGNFRVVLKQPRGLYKRSQQLAEKHGTGVVVVYENKSEKKLAKNVSLIRSTNMTR